MTIAIERIEPFTVQLESFTKEYENLFNHLVSSLGLPKHLFSPSQVDNMPPTLDAQHQSFLDAIIAEPEDDAVRLIYADWIDQQGEHDRASLIRIQCELEDLRKTDYQCPFEGRPVINCPCKDCSLDRCQTQLLTYKSRRDWFYGLVLSESEFTDKECIWFEHLGISTMIHLWNRGFVSTVACEWLDWNAQADWIIRHHPIEEVSLLTWPKLDHLPFAFTGVNRYWLKGRPEQSVGRKGSIGHLESELIMELLKINWPTVGKFTLPEQESDLWDESPPQ